MESLLFAINAVMPIILTVLLGYVLKKLGLISESFAKAANKLVFRVFLPAMLFLNIYGIGNLAAVNLGYVLYATVFTAVIFLVGALLVMLITKDAEHRGPLLQGTFRSNYALVGIPLATALFGEEGAIAASLLSAAIVPTYNILGVISLSLFHKDGKKVSVREIVLDIVRNPLIISIFVGLVTLLVRKLFVLADIRFRLTDIAPLYTLLEYLSRVATPMALLVLGAQFEFSSVSKYKKEILFATVIRGIVVPAAGLGIAYAFFRDSFGGAEFASLVAVFATPVAVSSVAMAQEMKSDTALAGQIVIFTTIVSAFTVFLATFLLRYLGVLA
ncbi:MAG: AEC family transporter [Clostridia bacterium]|nr:AEC family transporter [Clostridia bacterium]